MIRATDIPLAIQWHDGMLLSPQHFQEADRRAERLLAYHVAQVSPFPYGVVRLEIDASRLAAGIFHIVELEAVMPDGTLARHGAGSTDLSLDLRPHSALVRESTATIYLAIPPYHAAHSSADLARHRSEAGRAVVDEHTGEDPLEIPRITPSLRLVVAYLPPPRLVSLPVARIDLEGEIFVRTNYLPPQMRVTRTCPIGQICQRIAQYVREEAEKLADEKGRLSDSSDGDRIAKLRSQIQCLVAGLPPFEALLHSDNAHPFSLFLAAAAIIGHISLLTHRLVPPQLERYDHDDPRKTFELVRDTIIDMIRESITEAFATYVLKENNGKFVANFDASFQRRDLVIAVRPKRGVSEKDLLDWMNRALIGTETRIETMKATRVLGAERAHHQRIGDMVAKPNLLLFEVNGTNAFLEPGQAFAIYNAGDPDAEKGPSEVVLHVKRESKS